MHVIFQYPIVDCRSLLAINNGKLKYPEWPNPRINSKPFIRHFGAVKERIAGGSSNWTGEDYYCNAHLSMQYSNLHKQGFILAPNIQSTIYNSYRRYFSDGYYVGKIEAGFVDDIEKKIDNFDILNGTINLMSILKHYANLPVKINKKELKLYKVGPLLAESYTEESTDNQKTLDAQRNYVVAGEIAIMLIFSANARLELPKYASLLEEIPLPRNYGALKLYGYKLKHEGYTLKVWLIETPDTFSFLPEPVKKVLRNLRINLLRIHLEKETLRILLNGIKNEKFLLKKNSEEAQLVGAYIKKTTEKLFRKNRFTLDQKNLLDFALHSEETVAPGSFSALKEGVYYFQDKFTRANIERLLNGMVKKKVLLIYASPNEKIRLDIGGEYSLIKEGLKNSSDRYNYEIEIETSVKKTKFLDLLNEFQPDYLHLSMHSSLTEGLYFEDKDGNIFPMPVAEFSEILELFSRHHKPVVIVLSACNSKSHAESVKEYCKYAIGTQTAIPDAAGVLYASKFYSTLFEKNSTDIPYCHEAGKLALSQSKQFKEMNINGVPVHDIPILIT